MMKFLITGILFLFVLNEISSSSGISLGKSLRSPDGTNPMLRPSEPEDKYFEQKVDHFDIKEKKTWKQRYFSEDKYYESGGPVYLRIADREVLNSKYMNSGYWYTHGKQNKAMFFYISHRYYDKIKPVSSAETKDLRFLTVNQALADFAAFIKSKNEELGFPPETKWIVFGSSYAGNLAAWMRRKYTDLVYGAVASSAPVNAQMDYIEYLADVKKMLHIHNDACKKDITLANKELDDLVQSQSGRKNLGNMFKICDPLDAGKYNISYFATSLTEQITRSIQFDFESEKIKKICNKMMEGAEKKKPIRRYANVINMLMKDKKQKCLPTKVDTYLDLLQSTNNSFVSVTGRFWLYQACHEFGWFQTSNNGYNTFSKNVNLDYFVYVCSKVFGPSVDEKFIRTQTVKTNLEFQGSKINNARLLFVNGDADPWRYLQVTTKRPGTKVDVTTIKGGSHCSDILYGDSNRKAMSDTVKEIKSKLDSWLKE